MGTQASGVTWPHLLEPSEQAAGLCSQGAAGPCSQGAAGPCSQGLLAQP